MLSPMRLSSGFFGRIGGGGGRAKVKQDRLGLEWEREAEANNRIRLWKR